MKKSYTYIQGSNSKHAKIKCLVAKDQNSSISFVYNGKLIAINLLKNSYNTKDRKRLR